MTIDVYFGTTVSSKRWLNAIPEEFKIQEVLSDICRYKINPEHFGIV